MRDAVVAVIARDARWLWIRRGPAAAFAGHWAPPSGRVEPGETHAAAVAREVREELGLEVRARARVWSCPTHDGRFRLHWWSAQVVGGTLRPAPDEVSEVRWLDPPGMRALRPVFGDDLRYFERVALARLRTPRLELLRLCPDHQAAFAALHADPAVARWLGGRWTGGRSRRALRAALEHWRAHGFGCWMLRERASGRWIGRAGLRRSRLGGREETELYYALLPDAQGRGLAREAAGALVDVVLRDLGLASVAAVTLPRNHASRRVLRAAGLVPGGTVRHAGLPHVLYRLRAAPSARSPA